MWKVQGDEEHYSPKNICSECQSTKVWEGLELWKICSGKGTVEQCGHEKVGEAGDREASVLSTIKDHKNGRSSRVRELHDLQENLTSCLIKRGHS